MEKDSVLIEKDEYKGKRFQLSSKLYSNINEFQKMVDLVHAYGGVYTMKYSLSDIFVVKDKEDLEALKKKSDGLFDGEFILLDDFMKLCSEDNKPSDI